jgi:hypothetical protein
MHDPGDIAALSGCNHQVHVVWHQNVRVHSVPQVGAQEPDAVYYDLATIVFGKEGLPIFDVRCDEIRESFIGVTSKIWHTFPGLVGLGNPTYRVLYG